MGLIQKVQEFTESYRINKALRRLGGNPAVFDAILNYLGNSPVWSTQNFEGQIKKGYNINPYVYSCINLIISYTTKIPWTLNVVKDQKKALRFKSYVQQENTFEQAMNLKSEAFEEIPSHEILDVLEKPNPHQGRTEFDANYIGFKYITGNTYMQGFTPLYGKNAGLIKELVILPSQYMVIIAGSPANPILRYELRMNQFIEIPTEQIAHAKFFNPNYESGAFLYGLSPISVAGRAIETSNEGFVAIMKAFENMGARGVLSSGSKRLLKPDEAKRLGKSYAKKFGGPENANKIMVASSNITWTQIGLSPVDLAILDSNIFNEDVIGKVFGVPSEMFIRTKGSFTSEDKKEATKRFILTTISTAKNDQADEYNRFLVPGYAKRDNRKYVLVPDWESVAELQIDLDKIFKRAIDARNSGIIDGHEARKMTKQDVSTNPVYDKVIYKGRFADLESDVVDNNNATNN